MLAKFVNVLMTCGKKSIAESIIYGALEHLSERAKKAKHSDEEGGESSENFTAHPLVHTARALFLKRSIRAVRGGWLKSRKLFPLSEM